MKNARLNWRAAVTAAITIPVITALAITAIMLGPTDIHEESAWTEPLETAGIRTETDGAPRVVTEFGDFQCSYCAQFAQQVLPNLRRDLPADGSIRFEYRHYPFLSQASTMAAEASECARDQGAFTGYHDGLFNLTATRQALSEENLLETARQMDLELTEFITCTEQRTHRGRVQADKEFGKQMGVQGTPTIILNGQKLNWTDYPNLINAIRGPAAGGETY